jgi:hypothetical protein
LRVHALVAADEHVAVRGQAVVGHMKLGHSAIGRSAHVVSRSRTARRSSPATSSASCSTSLMSCSHETTDSQAKCLTCAAADWRRWPPVPPWVVEPSHAKSPQGGSEPPCGFPQSRSAILLRQLVHCLRRLCEDRSGAAAPCQRPRPRSTPTGIIWADRDESTPAAVDAVITARTEQRRNSGKAATQRRRSAPV